MMKVLFVMPKVGNWATHGKHVAPNQLYAQWAAFIRERGYSDISVIDCRAFEIEMDEMVEKIKAKNPDAVIIGDMLHSYGGFGIIHYFLEAAKKIKKALPKTNIIFGGLWFSSMPDFTLNEYPFVDYVVIAKKKLFLN